MITPDTYIECEKHHQHPAWYAQGVLRVEHIGTCYVLFTHKKTAQELA